MVVALLIVPLRFIVEWLRKAIQRLKPKNGFYPIHGIITCIIKVVVGFGVVFS